MRFSVFVSVILLAIPVSALAQTGQKPAANHTANNKKLAADKTTKSNVPTQADMTKMLEDEMKGMSEEDKVEMRKMMKGVMPGMAAKPGSAVEAFSDNKLLVPSKDKVRINSISGRLHTDADVSKTSTDLYGKLMRKIPAPEKVLLTTVMVKATSAPALMDAAVISLMQGHNYVAIALALKAVQAEPSNVVYQNNLAAVLSQSGYAETAIPILKKLRAQYPGNSTVLHNLGFAWLQLGETDSARKFLEFAGLRNPANVETKICRGLLDELRGDPKKAADYYVEAFEHAPNPFTETLVKNVNANSRLEQIDFNKLKNRIATYQYFKKDWITIPVLSDDVSSFEGDMKIKNGYANMFAQLDTKIESGIDAGMAEVEALAEKGFNEFSATMQKETQKGISMVSMPAVYIQKIMMAYIGNWQQDYSSQYQQLLEDVQRRKMEMTRSGGNDKCPDYDRKNNEFLKYANPLIRRFHTSKIEEAREWLNMFCTWSWYIAGNPKNVVLTQCITWTSFLAKMYGNAVHDQYAIAKTCIQQNGDGVAQIEVPAIPNFTCPAVVTIPLGIDQLRLSADAVNFDQNAWGIKRAAGARDHNLTLAYGIDKSYITEPGKYGNPSTKAGNGSMTPSGLGINDLTPLSDVSEELTPLSKITEELTPLSKITEELTPLKKIREELTPLDPELLDGDKASAARHARNAAMTRKILSELFQTECPGKSSPKNKQVSKAESPQVQTVITNGIGNNRAAGNFIKGLFN